MSIAKYLCSAVVLLLLLAGVAFAGQATVPAEIASAAPSGSRLVLFKSSGDQPDADAVAVYEAAANATGSHGRELRVFRKQDGTFREVLRSDRIIACSTCSPERDDPFMDGEQVKVTPGHIDIVQVYGAERPMDVSFAFAYDKGQWRVTSASRDDGDGHVTKLPLPASGLMKDFDGQWVATTFWSALALNDRDHSFYFLMDRSSEAALNAGLKKICDADGTCRVVARVQDGCLALARDASGQFHAAATQPTSSKVEASAKAMAACQAQGKGTCEAVRTSCGTGPVH